MERRSFLSAGGVAVLALAAGRTSIAGGVDADDPAAVVGEYYRRAGAAGDAEAFADDVRDLAHGASPLSRLAEDVPMAFDATLRQELADAAVVAEDVSADRIRSISDFLAASLDDAEVESIAAENAVVSAIVADDGVDGGEFELRWVVATDDDEWRLVWPGEPEGPAAVVREFYRRAEAAESAEAFADDVDELSHPVSPLSDVAADVPGFFDGARRQDLADAEVVARDVGAERIRGVSDFFNAWVDDEAVEAIAAENAVVAVTLRGDRSANGAELEWLVATAGDEWRLVWL